METTFDPKKITLTVAGRYITGYSADGIIVLTHNSNAVIPSIGAQGDTVYAINADNSGNAAIPLQSTSPSLAYLRDLCARKVQFQFSVVDANENDAIRVSESNCRILKMPDTPRNKENTTVTVNIYIPSLNYR